MDEFHRDGSRLVLHGRGYICKVCTRRKRYIFTRTPKGQFRAAGSIAKQRGVLFALSFDEYIALRQKPCTYCGGPLPETGMGLDQIVPAWGYTLTNAVPCCVFCNQIKSDVFTHAEALRFGQLVAAIRAEREAAGNPLVSTIGKHNTSRGAGPRKHFPKVTEQPEHP